MALSKKKEKKGSKKESAAPKAAAKSAPPKKTKKHVPADFWTLLLGLSALFFVTAAVVLGLNYYWYSVNGVI